MHAWTSDAGGGCVGLSVGAATGSHTILLTPRVVAVGILKRDSVRAGFTLGGKTLLLVPKRSLRCRVLVDLAESWWHEATADAFGLAQPRKSFKRNGDQWILARLCGVAYFWWDACNFMVLIHVVS